MNYEWLTPDFFSKAYDQFIRCYWNENPFPDQNYLDYHLDPHSFVFTPEEMGKIPGHIFGQSLLELSSEHLVGQINGFHSYVYRLKVWEKILLEYNELQRLHLIDEFVAPLSTSCLIAPFALKNQIIFSGVKIGMLLEKGKKQLNILEDQDIKSIEQLKPWVETWIGFNSLENALNAINDQNFLHSTKNFRHRYTHRLPPRIEMGVAANYRFAREGQSMKIYGGNEPPLPLATAIEASLVQHRACVSAFRAFWAMLKSKLEAM